METIKLKVNKKIYGKLLWLLNQFKPDDLVILDEKSEHKKHLEAELQKMDAADADFLTIEELDELLEKSIEPYENKNP